MSKRLSMLDTPVNELSEDNLVWLLNEMNVCFRNGTPLVSDNDYEHIYRKRLLEINPNHSFLNTVEPADIGIRTVPLPVPMLSTDKTYTIDKLESWYNGIAALCMYAGISTGRLRIRVTPKLDGFAMYLDGTKLYTRGDGKQGTDRSHCYNRIHFNNPNYTGPGELVINSDYFKQHLSKTYSNSRNVISTLIKPSSVSSEIQKAIDSKAVQFIDFATLDSVEGMYTDIVENWESTVQAIRDNCPYDTDGVVLEFMDPEIRTLCGSTRRHHKWQTAFKENSHFHTAVIKEVIATVSRTGRINPVAIMDPFILGDVSVNKATAHNYGMVRKMSLGVGSNVLVTRAGDVIPTITKAMSKGTVVIPDVCPSCSTNLEWRKDFLMCNNSKCSGRLVSQMVFFFNNLNNCDGFGPATINQLYENGINNVSDIYLLTKGTLVTMGFGDKQSQNLIDAITNSKINPVDDYTWLASFGIEGLGNSNAERLLTTTDIPTLLSVVRGSTSIARDMFVCTDGIGETTANRIVIGLSEQGDMIETMLQMGWNLNSSKRSIGRLEGHKYAITGTLDIPRVQLVKQIKQLGGKIVGSVTKNTTALITGDNPGARKLETAKSLNVQIIDLESLRL